MEVLVLFLGNYQIFKAENRNAYRNGIEVQQKKKNSKKDKKNKGN